MLWAQRTAESSGDIPLLFKPERSGDGWKGYDANVEGVLAHMEAKLDG